MVPCRLGRIFLGRGIPEEGMEAVSHLSAVVEFAQRSVTHAVACTWAEEWARDHAPEEPGSEAWYEKVLEKAKNLMEGSNP